MQYIKKGNTPPADWESWFTKGNGDRSYDYKHDSDSLRQLPDAKDFLIKEQHGLCAYCQQQITLKNSSIEHVIPKELNVELSTNYYNLVAVCKTQTKDPTTGRMHCDDEKGSKVITPFIFFSNSEAAVQKNNQYFKAYSDGTIAAKDGLNENMKKQVEAFIEVVNLNHYRLIEERRKHYQNLFDIFRGITNPYQRSIFWGIQYKRIMGLSDHVFRQYLIIMCGSKAGIN